MYFHDVGLAAYLLGIENETHISRDPLRGNLFENMVIAEAVKHQFNRGKRSNIYFYRDSKGNEVDLLLTVGPDIFPIEIKSGMTITRDFFKGLNVISRVLPDRILKAGGLVYGGDEPQKRTGVTIVPITRLEELFNIARE